MDIIENLYTIAALVCIHFNDIKFVETADNFKKLQCACLLLGFFLIPIISTLLTYSFSNYSNRFEALKNVCITNLIGFVGTTVYVFVFSGSMNFILTFTPVDIRAGMRVALADFIIFWLTQILIMQVLSQMPIAIRIFSSNSPKNYEKLVRHKYSFLIASFLLLILIGHFDLISDLIDLFFMVCFFALGLNISKRINKDDMASN